MLALVYAILAYSLLSGAPNATASIDTIQKTTIKTSNCQLDSISPHKQRTTTFLEQGNRFANAGKWTLAVQAYRSAIELDPCSANAQGNLGYVYTQLNQLEEAVATLQQAVNLQPEDAI